MAVSVNARIAKCDERINELEAELELATNDKEAAKAEKALESWRKKKEVAQAGLLKSLEKKVRIDDTVSVRSTSQLWEPSSPPTQTTEKPFEDEYSTILNDLQKSTPAQNDDRRRVLLKNIRMLEMSCGLMHDLSLDEAPIEDLEAHHTSIKQQCVRQNKSLTSLAANMYVGLFVNGSHIINHFSDDLGFYVDKDVMNTTFHDSGTMANMQDAIAEIFEDNPEVYQYFATASRGLPRLLAVTAMATLPAVRIGTIEKKC